MEKLELKDRITANVEQIIVKNGLINKEISVLLNIAVHMVEKHRRMARNKLGLANKGINLRIYLISP